MCVLLLVMAVPQLLGWYLCPGPLLEGFLLMSTVHHLQPGLEAVDFEYFHFQSHSMRYLFLVLCHLMLSLKMSPSCSVAHNLV